MSRGPDPDLSPVGLFTDLLRGASEREVCETLGRVLANRTGATFLTQRRVRGPEAQEEADGRPVSVRTGDPQVHVVLHFEPAGAVNPGEEEVRSWVELTEQVLRKLEAEREARESETALSYLSHDLRTPLNTVGLAAELLTREHPDNHRVTSRLKRAVAAATARLDDVDALRSARRTTSGAAQTAELSTTLRRAAELAFGMSPDRPKLTLRDRAPGSEVRTRTEPLVRGLSILIRRAASACGPAPLEILTREDEGGIRIEIGPAGEVFLAADPEPLEAPEALAQALLELGLAQVLSLTKRGFSLWMESVHPLSEG